MLRASTIVGALVLLVVAAIWWTQRNSQPEHQKTISAEIDLDSIQPSVKEFCGNCHAYPPPEAFPKDAWFAEVEQGYRFYVDSRRSDLHPPPMNDVIAYYRALAPVSMDTNSSRPTIDHRLEFTHTKVPLTAGSRHAAVSFIQSDLSSHGFVFCDMHSGEVAIARMNEKDRNAAITRVTTLSNPAHSTWCDLDRDGRIDLLVADLGSFAPGDHEAGKVVWLRSTGGTPEFETRVILDRVSRVADVQPADFDGDGDLDLVVAEFGWRKTGRVLLLTQQQSDDGQIHFEPATLDQRHGTIHVPVVDFNQDGRPDFVALISQEYEVVELFLNRSNGQFEKQLLFSADDPAYGSSGIELVDFDRDGDMDVLYTNGDTLDSLYLKPSHGVHLLENEGRLPLNHRRLAVLPGTMRAVAADLDQDEDLDVVATVYMPASLKTRVDPECMESLIWLENMGTDQFAKHVLEIGGHGHIGLLAKDLNGDSRIDLVVGDYSERFIEGTNTATIWWNEGHQSP